MVRPWNVTEAVLDQGKWYDYAGQSIHGDYTVALDQSNAAVVTEKVAHEPGVIDYDYTAAAGSRQTYLRGNLIGTTEATSGASPGSPPSAGRAVYSAFGERVYANGVGGGRYGYAGAWGYQAAGGEECGPAGEEFLCDPLAELGWLHVGERYYDPACGRFVQRDPIGIAGGWNVYVYVNNRPAKATDPEGLDGAEYRFRQFIEKPILEGRPEEAWANARAQAAGALVGIGTITIFFAESTRFVPAQESWVPAYRSAAINLMARLHQVGDQIGNGGDLVLEAGAIIGGIQRVGNGDCILLTNGTRTSIGITILGQAGTVPGKTFIDGAQSGSWSTLLSLCT